MTSLSQPSSCSINAVYSTENQLLITCVSRHSGLLISVILSSLTKSQSVWRSSNSRVFLSKQHTKIVTKTLSATWVSPDISLLPTGTILILTKAPKNVWCDYCKDRFGVVRRTTDNFGTVPRDAVWTCKSELPRSKGRERHYCHECAKEVQTWTNGTIFSLQQQGEFITEQKENQLNGISR